MKLHDLCELFVARKFPALGAPAHPARDAVVHARSATASAVAIVVLPVPPFCVQSATVIMIASFHARKPTCFRDTMKACLH